MGGGMIVAALLVSKLCGKSGGGSSKNATAIKTNEIVILFICQFYVHILNFFFLYTYSF